MLVVTATARSKIVVRQLLIVVRFLGLLEVFSSWSVDQRPDDAGVSGFPPPIALIPAYITYNLPQNKFDTR